MANGKTTRLYIDSQTSLNNTSNANLIEYTLRREMPLIFKMLQLWPSPQQRFESLMEPLSNELGQFTQTGTAKPSIKGYSLNNTDTIHISTSPLTDGHENVIFTIESELINKQELSMLVESKNQLRHQFFSRSAFKYFSSISSSENIEKVRGSLAALHNYKPTPLSHLATFPAEMYRTEKGLEKIVINAVRNIEGLNSITDLDTIVLRSASHITKMKAHFPNLSHTLDNLSKLKSYLNSDQRSVLQLNIELEVNHLRAFTKDAFSLTHYNKSLFDVVVTNNGMIKVRPDDWASYTNSSMVKSIENSFFDSLLPEDAGRIDRNPMNKITNATMLIGNVNIQRIPITAIAPRMKFPSDSIHALEKEWKMPSSPMFVGGSTSLHSTTIDDAVIFKGFFEGIPHIDKENFKSDMVNLMQGEKSAKLSGAQFKLPITLYEKNGEKHIERQRGNDGFTHIAKMPMPDFDQITLAEWLGLTLLKESGLNVSKFQMVSYENEMVSYTGEESLINEKSISEATINNQSLGDDFVDETAFFDNLQSSLTTAVNQVTEVIDNSQSVPFLISERFDIPYASDENPQKTISLDLGAVCMTTSSQKYELSFEDVASNVKKRFSEKVTNEVFNDIYKQIIGSYLLHNNDLHLKNITVLGNQQEDGTYAYKVSPIYDVILTPLVITGNLNVETQKGIYRSALSINGTHFPSKMDIVELATGHFNIPKERALSVFDEVMNNMNVAVKKMVKNIPVEIKTRGRWCDCIETGLAIVERNLKHIKEHGIAYGAAPETSDESIKEMKSATNIMPQLY
ncbi:hypothetical protein BCT01_08530 [Vibrio tasmaniensis]|nr:HipA domain-containing protein [Vibrio tasmaniensis]PMO80327.1 hypothetical protein BCT01_08530 [Vibrio tasmaniensis]PMP17805.1 hypothetical protein BCS92_05200 [Vibrio tasmaniensis]